MGSVDSFTCANIKKLIEERKLEEAYAAVNNKTNEDSVKEYAWELLPSILSVLFDKSPGHPSHVLFCESILEKLANTGNPQELFVGLLEQTETYNDDTCFKVLLKPLQITLLRLPSKRGKSLEWALNTMSHHVASLPLPQPNNFEGEELMLMDLDPNVQRIVSVLQMYVLFFEPFVQEVSLKSAIKPTVYLDRVKQQRNILAGFLLKVLYHPLIYLDLSHTHGRAKSSPRVCAEKVVKYICCLISNLLLLYDPLFLDVLKKCIQPDESKISDSTRQKKLHNNSEGVLLPISNFSYLIFAEKLADDILPTVYTHKFLFHKHIPLISQMLSKPDNMIIYKGLGLFSSLLNNISKLELSSSVLDVNEYFELGKLLGNIMIHCQLLQHRQFALQLLSDYLSKFDYKGKYNLLVSLFNTTKHSGFHGLIISWYKDTLHSCIQQKNISNIFMENNLKKFLMKAVELPDGTETDLLEHSDHVISVLNFLRYLLLLDRQLYKSNGIWNYMNAIEDNFLKPLRTSLNFSKAHYKLELQRIKEEKSSGGKGKNINTTVTVAGQILPNVPPDNQIKILNSALLTFDIIESVLARVEEIELNL